MKKNTLCRLFSVLALFICPGQTRCGFFPDDPFSDAARGTTAAQFLKVPPSARFAALGGAGLALDGGPDAFFLNPAGLAAAGRAESAFAATYETLLEENSRTGLVFSRGSAAGVFSAGLIYNNSGAGLEKLDGAGRGSGAEITAYDAAFGAGWARSFGPADFGFNIKYIKSRLAEVSGGSPALDAGFLFKAGPGASTDLSLAVRNFGPPLKLGSESAPLPFEAAGGLRWRYSPVFDILLEGRLPVDHTAFIILSGEWFIPYLSAPAGARPRSGFFVRSGMNFKNYDDHGFMGSFSGGFGLKAGGLCFDYAFSPYGELGAAHRFTAGFGWGGVKTAYNPAVKSLQGKESLVVAPFSRVSGVTQTQAEVIRNLVEAELVKTGNFRIVERTSLDFILKEKKLVASGIGGERIGAELGRFFKASMAAFGLIYKDNNGYLITVRLVDPGSGEILRSESAQAREDYLFRDAARSLAAALVK